MAPIRPLVFAGTQVVVLREARGSNDAPVHPRGAVGIIVRTPAGVETEYLVRFPDGFDASSPVRKFLGFVFCHWLATQLCANIQNKILLCLFAE